MAGLDRIGLMDWRRSIEVEPRQLIGDATRTCNERGGAHWAAHLPQARSFARVLLIGEADAAASEHPEACSAAFQRRREELTRFARTIPSVSDECTATS